MLYYAMDWDVLYPPSSRTIGMALNGSMQSVYLYHVQRQWCLLPWWLLCNEESPDISHSSCMTWRLPMSRKGSAASTCFSSLKRPATTMHLFSGVLHICCKRNRATSALFSSLHFVGRCTSLHSIGRLIATKPLPHRFHVPRVIECSW